MPRTATVTPGKTSFVKEYLHDHPDAPAKEVNEAWKDAGMQGTISHPVISEVRRVLGMITMPRSRSRTATSTKSAPTKKGRGKTAGKQTRQRATTAVETRAQQPSRASALLAVEVEIDRLIFQVMNLGKLSEVETALRSARRGFTPHSLPENVSSHNQLR